MDVEGLAAKRIVLFAEGLAGTGGVERIVMEEEDYLKRHGAEVVVLTFECNQNVFFDNTYQPNIRVIAENSSSRPLPFKFVTRVRQLRRALNEIRPDIVVSENPDSCEYLLPGTLFSPFPYVTHFPGTVFWLNNELVYARVHRRAFDEIRDSIFGHKQFVSRKAPRMGMAKRLKTEVIAVLLYLGIRRAKRIFVHTSHMRWEVDKLYGRDAIPLKGAFPDTILNYKQKQDIKAKLGLAGRRMILSVGRLDYKKRVDLLIRAFNLIRDEFKDLVLVIGGSGPEEEHLKKLVAELGIQDRVKFVGRVKEDELWDYYLSCDVFGHPFWREFAITPYELLALQKKVVWSTETDADESMKGNQHIFAADPTVDGFAQGLRKALTTEVNEPFDMSAYTWDRYFSSRAKQLLAVISETTGRR
ncbi:MAG: glycosyltransferase family 4 protein [Chloroflexi bacterium]|nr:glycosyltransferase family 4 protein [Chloroflexota bacterium]